MIGSLKASDVYMDMLETLPDEEKLDLISKLSASMRNDADTKRTRPNLRTCFKGDWSDVDADELRNHE